MLTDYVIHGPTIVSQHQLLRDTALVIGNGKIKKMIALSQLSDYAAIPHVTFATDTYLLPGFIDMHVHGANGCDVMDATPKALHVIASALAASGTTAFLATTMTATVADITHALSAISQFVTEPQIAANLLGVHLEGPFLSVAKMGAQNPSHIVQPNVQVMQAWQRQFPGLIKLVTLAPELDANFELIHYLKSHNIIAALGHTNASFDEANAAIDAGCSHATHLFNAMPALHHRHPGAAGAVLLSDKINAELIVDGVHLHPAIVALALKLKSADKLMLVSDAMRASCMPDGEYDLGGQRVFLKDGQAQLRDGTLAGSVITLANAVQNMLKFTDCSLPDVVKMASANPAKALQVDNHLGDIAETLQADFVILSPEFDVLETIIAGNSLFKKT